MNPWTMLASLLQQLPIGVRRTIYSVVNAAGALLAIAELAGWRTIGPIDVDEALRTYALIASPTGVLALANAQPDKGTGPADADAGTDWDLELPRLGGLGGFGRDDGDPPFDPDEDFGGFDVASFEAGAAEDRADDEAFA